MDFYLDNRAVVTISFLAGVSFTLLSVLAILVAYGLRKAHVS